MPFYQGKKEFSDRYLGAPTTWTTEITKEALAGDILMSVRAPVGPINEATQKICIGRGLAAIRPKGAILREFLWYSLLWLQPTIKGNSGAVFESINKAAIEALSVALPPLEEQRRIVAILDEAFDGLSRARANAEANLQSARELFERELARVFSGESATWTTQSIGDLCTIRSGATVPKSQELPVGEIPYVKVADMNYADNLEGILSSTRFLKYADVPDRNIIPRGATIFPKRGGAILTNKKRKVLTEICADLNIMAVIPGPTLDEDFLYFFFLSVDMRKIGTGSAIPQINNYDVVPLEIPVPSTKAEQALVAQRLANLRQQTAELVQLFEGKLQHLEDLRQSLLQKAFAGELTAREFA